MLGDLWNWVAGVFGRIGDVSIYWLLLALALKTAESAFIGLGWRNILRAAYPRAGLSFKTAWGASRSFSQSRRAGSVRRRLSTSPRCAITPRATIHAGLRVSALRFRMVERSRLRTFAARLLPELRVEDG